MSHERTVNRFLVGRKLGQGSFGKVYVATDKQNGDEVAIKMENEGVKYPQLLNEAKIYSSLSGGLGIPSVHWSGTAQNRAVMAIDLLGPSIEELFGFCNKAFSLKTILMLGDQLVNRIEYVHSKHLIHRDIKPENFLVGTGANESLVYVVDFGLSKRYRHPTTLVHAAYSEASGLTGTARYASVNTHLGIEQSRRDDLESIGYLLVYLAKGALPWQGVKANSKKEKYEKIMRKKVSTPLGSLCRGLPEEFAVFIRYCRSLRFEEMPDYLYLRGLLRDLLFRKGMDYDLSFDWVVNRPPAAKRGAGPRGVGNSSRGSTTSR